MLAVSQILRDTALKFREIYGNVLVEHILQFHQSLRSAYNLFGRQSAVLGDRHEAYVHVRCFLIHMNCCM